MITIFYFIFTHGLRNSLDTMQYREDYKMSYFQFEHDLTGLFYIR